jgi:hypothetical protein
VPKHASQRSRRLAHLKVVASVIVVVAFVALFAAGATGLIGSPDSGSDDNSSSVGLDAPPATHTRAGTDDASADPTATSEPTAIVTDVPPQDVKGAKKLKRSLAWLRRGLADETTFRVGTFNVLGNSHTGGGGNKRGWASGTTRMGWAYSLIQQANLDVVGFQEFEDPQYARFSSLAGSAWDVYPGHTLDRGSIRDSIAWRTDTWEMIRRPVIKLENIESGRDVWFFNVHNPADTPAHGNNAHWRGVAVGLETTLANQLSADGTPVVFTGDYNDRAEVFCPMTGNTDLVAANGGDGDGGCSTPDHMDVDWIFGSGMQWSDFVSASQGIVGRVSDHPFVYAESYIPEEPLGGDQPSDSASPSEDSSASPDSSGN